MEEIKKVARLANLPLTEEEIIVFDKQLSETIAYINDLNEVPTKGIKPTPQVTHKINEFREDTVLPSLSQDLALQNAKKTHNGFVVSKISWD